MSNQETGTGSGTRVIRARVTRAEVTGAGATRYEATRVKMSENEHGGLDKIVLCVLS